MFRPPRQPALRPLLEAGRRRGSVALVPANTRGATALLAALRRGEWIGILPDQVPTGGEGEWAPFFGRPAFTMTLAAKLIERTGASALMSGLRAAAPRPRLDDPDRAADAAGARRRESATAAMNRALEAAIRRRPEQYLWSYHRYRAPAGVTPPDAAAEGRAGRARAAGWAAGHRPAIRPGSRGRRAARRIAFTRRRSGPPLEDPMDEQLRIAALEYHRLPDRRQDLGHADQAPDQPARPGARLFPGRRRRLRGDRRRSRRSAHADLARQPRRGHHQRHRRARPRQHRAARRQAGDGRQGRPVQEVRRHRRLRHRGRRDRPGRAGRRRSRGSSRPSAASTSRTSRRRTASTSSASCASG